MRVLRLRGRAPEIDEAVSRSAQKIADEWWSRWSLDPAMEAPRAEICLHHDEQSRAITGSQDGFRQAVMDSEGVGYAFWALQPVQILERALGAGFIDGALSESLAERMSEDLTRAIGDVVGLLPCRACLSVHEVTGIDWDDPRTSAREIVLLVGDEPCVRWRWSAAAVDVLTQSPAMNSQSSARIPELGRLMSIEANCQFHLALTGLHWRDIAGCEAGDVLLGQHGVKVPVTLTAANRQLPLIFELDLEAGERAIRLIEPLKAK
jgi:hypothetical protein